MKDQNDNLTLDLLKGQTMAAVQFLEEVKDAPIDSADILTDEQLGRGGLVKIEAFVRTKTSAAASRKAKQREAQKAEGMGQVNLTVPLEKKEQLKAVAVELSNGKSLEEALKSVTSHGQVTNPAYEEMMKVTREHRIGQRVLLLTGWRRMIAKAIGII